MGRWLLDSVHPPPPKPRWATALKFVIPTEADPDFLHHDTTQGHICTFRKESRTKFANATKPRQEIRGSVGDGPAVSLSGVSECAVGESPPGSVSPSTQTAGPSPTLRFGRDDKLEGGGPPLHGWSGMDRSRATATNPVSFAFVLFNAFSKLRRSKGRSPTNLHSSDSQPSLRDSLGESSSHAAVQPLSLW